MLKPLIFIEILIVIGTALHYMSMTRAMRREIGYLPGIVFGVLAATAFLAPNLLIVHIVTALLPIALARSKLAVGMVTAVGLIALPALPTDLALAGVPLFKWTIQNTLGVGALVALFIARGKRASVPPWTDAVLLIVMAVLIVVSARGTAWTNYLRELAVCVFTYAIPVYVVTRSIRNAIEARVLLAALAGAGIILAVIVLYEARGGWPLYAPLGQHYGFELNGIIVKWRGGLMRAYGPLSEATNMGFILVICFAAALAARRAFVSNSAYIGVVALIALGSLAPQSRGGLIGIAVAFVISSFYRRGVGSIAQMAAAGMLLFGAYIASLVFGAIGNQINTSLDEATGTGDYRTELLRRGMEEFWKNPLFGDQYENVIARMQDMVQGEGIVDFVNSYLYFALFAGGIGLVFFCLAFLWPMGRLAIIRARLTPNSAERDLGGFCLAVLGSAAVMLAFTSYLSRPAIYLLIASGFALMLRVPVRARRSQARATASVNPPGSPQAA